MLSEWSKRGKTEDYPTYAYIEKTNKGNKKKQYLMMTDPCFWIIKLWYQTGYGGEVERNEEAD